MRAEQLEPNDFVIIGNIAYSYYMKRDKPNAIKYYKRLLEIGNDEAKKTATAKLSELKKWN